MKIEGLKNTIGWRDNLIRNISVPSAIHPYSLAIEYMKDKWFLSMPKFKNDFFKTVYVDGKHLFDDQRMFNQIKTHGVEKPAVSISPDVDVDWNRDMVDLYPGGLAVYTHRNRRYDNRIIRDDAQNIYLSMDLRQLQMQFEFHIRVATKAEQLNLLEYIRMACRIGSTQGEYIDIDCLLPRDIILSIATDSGFALEKLSDGNMEVKNVNAFVSYLNAHSRFPITYKFRGITGTLEYFIRVPSCYAHISCLDGISKDVGERQGQLSNNFHIDFTAILQMPMPSMYMYYSKNEHAIKSTDNSIIGLYQFTISRPPERNELGWSKFIESDYISDELEVKNIEFMKVFNTISDSDDIKRSILKVLKHTIDLGLSPSIFMDVKMFNGQRPLHSYVDWENNLLILDTTLTIHTSQVAIYVDLGYINNTISNLEHLDEQGNRLSTKIDESGI